MNEALTNMIWRGSKQIWEVSQQPRPFVSKAPWDAKTVFPPILGVFSDLPAGIEVLFAGGNAVV